MLNITFTIECHCGEDAESTIAYLDLSPDQPIRIDAEMALGQQDFHCQHCGCVTGTGDLYTEVGSAGVDCDGDGRTT
jgi:hypothetical protein